MGSLTYKCPQPLAGQCGGLAFNLVKLTSPTLTRSNPSLSACSIMGLSADEASGNCLFNIEIIEPAVVEPRTNHDSSVHERGKNLTRAQTYFSIAPPSETL
jgi:hypothetical protein